MKLLSKVIVTAGLAFILFGCAGAAYQSGRVDHQLEGNGTVTKQDLREMKELEDKREAERDFWEFIDFIADIVMICTIN